MPSHRSRLRSPTRIDFGGGWTDVPPYCEREGGFVCNVAIDRYATATAFHGSAEPPDRDASLVNAIVRRSGLTNVAVTVESDFPLGAGLGGSSSASAAIHGALAEFAGIEWNPREIAESGRRVEVEDLGVAGGRQDHYAATFGGALALTFTDSVDVRRIELEQATRSALERRMVLVYTGESRISGNTITAVLGAYESGERRVVNALARMRELAMKMAIALERGDIDTLSELVGEHWTHQRALHPAIPTPRIDEIIGRAAAAGALGAKALGASGGGTVLVMARDDDVERVRDAVSGLGTLLPFGLDFGGLSCAGD